MLIDMTVNRPSINLVLTSGVSTARCTTRIFSGWVVGWMDEWVDGWWVGGWVNRWVGRWVGVNFFWCFNRDVCHPGIKVKDG